MNIFPNTAICPIAKPQSITVSFLKYSTPFIAINPLNNRCVSEISVYLC